MIILKLILYIVVFISSSFIGFLFGGKYSKRVTSLASLQQSIRLLQTEIIVFANPFPYAINNISKRISEDMVNVYSIIMNEMIINQSGDLYNGFIESIYYLKNNCLLKEEDIDVFLSLGKVIGKTDRIDQELQFKYVLNEIDHLIVDAKEEKIKNEKMYRSLGILMGLGMIIILI